MELNFQRLNNENKRDEGQNVGAVLCLHGSVGCLCAECEAFRKLKRKITQAHAVE